MAHPWKRRRILTLLPLAAAGLTFYGAYKLYHHPSVARNVRALASVSDAVSSTADTVSLLSSDLHGFLASDSDQIPTSLKQVSKLARSDDFSAAIARASGAVASGILRGVNGPSSNGAGFYDRVVDGVFSDAAAGFASVVAGSFGRGLVEGFYSSGVSESEAAVPWWLELICEDKLKQVIGDCVQVFVATAVGVYLEKTMDINIYDEIFAGLTNAKHEAKMKDVMVSVCNGAVETFVRTSHRVLTGSGSVVGRRDGVERNVELERDRETSASDQRRDDGGWVGRVSSTLDVPGNRRFVLDLTGRATFEIVRSFLDFSVHKLYENGRRGVDVVRGEIAERGMEVLMYVSAKSMLIFTICLALCLHVLSGTRILIPAWVN